MAETTQIGPFIALTIGFVVFFVGQHLTQRIAILRDYNIPEPVSGGVTVALATWVFHSLFSHAVVFDLSARDALLVYFFTTVGLNARFADLVRGGVPLALMLAMTIGFMILQNLVGMAGTMIWGLPSQAGILLGTASLIGGHGTAIAWGPVIAERYGVAGATELGVAMATMGLVAASLLGGPIAKYLVEKNNLKSDPEEEAAFIVTSNEHQTDRFD